MMLFWSNYPNTLKYAFQKSLNLQQKTLLSI